MTYVVTTKYLASDKLSKWAKQHGHSVLQDNGQLRSALLKVPARIVSDAKLPELVVDVKFKDMQKLQKKRLAALKRGFLIQTGDDLVPAKIRFGGQTIKVKARLKGDLVDHLQGDKWSFRIHVKGKNHLFGMRRFSIQHPAVRGYQGELLFLETLRHLGVLAPRYLFANVVVNGRDIGVMAIEEHFSKELLEKNGRKESVIIRFDESFVWEAKDGNRAGLAGAFDSYLNTPIDAFRSSQIKASPTLTRDYAIAGGLLRGFVNGLLPPSEVFDAELMGHFLAATELWGSWHSLSWRNMRFYYNPISARLEPIGFDSNIEHRSGINRRNDFGEPIVAVMRDALLNDAAIYAVYRATLGVLAKELDSGVLTNLLAEKQKEVLPALQKEFFLLQPFKLDELIQRAKLLSQASDDSLRAQAFNAYPTLLQAYLLKDEKGPYLELINAVPQRVAVQSLQWLAKGGAHNAAFEAVEPQQFPLLLAGTPLRTLPHSTRIYYKAPRGDEPVTLQVVSNIVGEARRYTTQARADYFVPLDKNPQPNSTLEAQLALHPFLKVSADNRRIEVSAGEWVVEGSIVIPKGYRFFIGEGTTLRFAPRGSIVSHSAVEFHGSAAAPIVLEGLPTETGDDGWSGLVVLSAEDDSSWQHVIVRRTTGMSWPNWSLTGGVTFYRSDITIKNSRFEDSRGEDALNIVHAKFELKDIEIIDTASDAFDGDFVNGRVIGGLFQGIGHAGGGDGVDISGSDIEVIGTRFIDVNDKSLSVGEGSSMVASSVTISQTGTGAASKDGSKLEIKDSTIEGAQVANLMAYMKKPEYGGATIDAENMQFVGDVVAARAQLGSRITIDGNAVESEDVDVKNLYKTVMKKGAR